MSRRILGALLLSAAAWGGEYGNVPPSPKDEKKMDDRTIRDRPANIMKLSTWKRLIQQKDFLSVRMGIKELIKNHDMTKEETLWAGIRELFLKTPEVGQDLRSLWDKYGPRKNPLQKEMEARLRGSDQFLSVKDYPNALKEMMGMARSIGYASDVSKHRYEDAREFVLYMRLAVARALYGNHQYKQSAMVYSSIPASYYDIAQVLYERMWANYRSGRVDWTLGDLESLSSGYFGRIQRPDALLIGLYSAWELCQDAVAEKLQKTYLDNLKALRTGARFYDLHLGDPLLLALKRALDTPVVADQNLNLFTRDERQAERRRIAGFLIGEIEKRKTELLKDYETLWPFMKDADKIHPYLVQKTLPSRTENFRGDYNMSRLIADEIWFDEVGYLLYRPAKACDNGKNMFESDDNMPPLPKELRSLYYKVDDFKKFQDMEVTKRMFFYPRY